MIPARLRWVEDQPFSQQFGDIYHSPDGPAEVQRVFVAPQRLTERLTACRGTFTAGELGFGTGLNFAVIAQRHLECSSPDARLHFISVEKHPIHQRDFAELAHRRKRTLPIYEELSRAYPPALQGWHRRHLAGGRITLSVFFGDGAAGFADIVDRQRLPVDAWLLDGFAPDRNPELWRDELWRTIASLSDDGTTVATFSAVGAVRRALAAAGFSMQKVDQRPHKRHSLVGTFSASHRGAFVPPRSVVVIGAGLAGVATAHHLANRGVAVSLFDASDPPPNRMAGTLFHCRLQPDGSAAAELRCLSFLHSSHWYETVTSSRPDGVLQFPSHTLPRPRLEELADRYAHSGNWVYRVDATTASSLAGLPVRESGLYFPHGRALHLGRLCGDLARHASIDYRPGTRIRTISTDTAAGYVTTTAETLASDHVVLCTGAATNDFTQARYLELVPVWGQIERIRPARAPIIPLVGEGFMIPLGSHWGVGATYEHKTWEGDRARNFNLQRFDGWWRALTGTHPLREPTGNIRGARAVASDRMPIVGPLFDLDGERTPRLLVNTGHGSQGTVTAPFAAECVASELTGEFAPCTRAEMDVLGSLRFRTRQARRGLRHGARD
jgi:tRNA 5-methylaminomethyl-2-thiouridine biosynthesis bifunctional protein